MSEEGQSSQEQGPAPAPARRDRMPVGPLRLAVALAAAGALVWTATAVDGTLGTGPAAGGGSERTDGGEGATSTGQVVAGSPGPAAPVRSATLVCAAGAGLSGSGSTQVRAVTAPGEVGDVTTEPGTAASGTATLGSPGAGDQTVAPGGAAATVQTSREESLGPVLTAEGGAAAGVVATELTTSVDPDGRGLALTPCSAPAEVVHLLGGGAGAGRVEQVVVANPGTDPVTVELEVWGAAGPVEVTGGSGLVVPAQGRAAYRLDALAPGVEAPAVRVSATGGPVVAHLAETHREGTVDLGTDVVPAVAAPARELVVPALPFVPGEGPDRRTLLRVLATEQEAVVELRALTPDGAQAPAEPVLVVPAGSTVEVPVEGLSEGTTALRLRSDTPVTAALMAQEPPASDEPVVVEDDAAATSAAPDDAAETSAAPDDAAETTTDPQRPAPRVIHHAGELAWVTAVPLATDPVGIAIPPLDAVPAARARLALSAVDGAGAEVVWLDEAGTTVETVTLAHDSTTVLDVPEGALAAWARTTGQAGIAASLLVEGEDEAGSYLSAATLPAVPWTRTLTTVTPVIP